MRIKYLLAFTLFALRAGAQEASGTQALLQQLLQRLDSLEQQNRLLVKDVEALRKELHAAKTTEGEMEADAPKEEPPIEDRVTVNERRISELAQTKVEASQKFPISLNGMLLFNAFTNSSSAANENASEYALLTGPSRSGATLRQTLIGLQAQGPSLPGGGKVNGSLLMDFWGGYATPGSNWFRLRRADISLDWARRSFTVGQDKPLIAPYQPDSLAEVGVPPLAGAGNFWLWLPQARYEERIRLDADNGITGQLALLQTSEKYAQTWTGEPGAIAPARPALEGRAAFWHKFDDTHKVEVGSAFHTSTSHIAGFSVPSRIASFDWHVAPAWKLDFTGTMYTGQNVAGLGALGNSLYFTPDGRALPFHSAGGWAQVSLPLTTRLSLNIFSGIEDDRGSYVSANAIARNLVYASNLMYHLGPNIVVGFEGLQMRTRSFEGAKQLNNHYDLALGYLF